LAVGSRKSTNSRTPHSSRNLLEPDMRETGCEAFGFEVGGLEFGVWSLRFGV